MESVARLDRAAVADPVRQDDEEAHGVQRRTRTVEDAREPRRRELTAGATGAVQDQDAMGDAAAGIACRPAERPVVEPQRGRYPPNRLRTRNQRFAGRSASRRMYHGNHAAPKETRTHTRCPLSASRRCSSRPMPYSRWNS